MGRAAVQSLFTSALEYHARVPGQRDAALEPLDAGYASRGTIRPTPDFVPFRPRPGNVTVGSLRTRLLNKSLLLLDTIHREATKAQEGPSTAARAVPPGVRGVG